MSDIPYVEESKGFKVAFSIWLIPITALLIALWLAYAHYAKLGPLIEITFEKNQGLKSGQSQIRYRDIPIGTVEKISLMDEGDKVKVTARIEKEAIDFLNEKARFWIVNAEVGSGGISGLETIISGAYINMYGKKDTMTKRQFVGREEPYIENKEGEVFRLSASAGYNLVKGTPILFKGMKAGYVHNVNISSDGKSVEMSIFIEKNYLPYVRLDSKFWVQSTMDIAYSNGKLDLSVAPLSNILRGGIEFSLSSDHDTETAPRNHLFPLYKNFAIASEKQIGSSGDMSKEYLMGFEQSIAKLNTDASVLYDGFDVGRVKSIGLVYDSNRSKIKGNVVVDIDTHIFYDPKTPNITGEENLKSAVRKGLRASIQEHDPISGLLYIDLAFVDTNITSEITNIGRYSVFPTYSNLSSLRGLAKLIESIDNTVNSFGEIIKENRQVTSKILADLDEAIMTVNSLVGSKEFAKLPKELNKTMGGLQKTLASLDRVMQGNSDQSLLSSQLTQTLKEVSQASKETQRMLKKIEQKPNSLIFGD